MAALPLCCSRQFWQNDLHRPTGRRLQILKRVKYRRLNQRCVTTPGKPNHAQESCTAETNVELMRRLLVYSGQQQRAWCKHRLYSRRAQTTETLSAAGRFCWCPTKTQRQSHQTPGMTSELGGGRLTGSAQGAGSPQGSCSGPGGESIMLQVSNTDHSGMKTI